MKDRAVHPTITWREANCNNWSTSSTLESSLARSVSDSLISCLVGTVSMAVSSRGSTSSSKIYVSRCLHLGKMMKKRSMMLPEKICIWDRQERFAYEIKQINLFNKRLLIRKLRCIILFQMMMYIHNNKLLIHTMIIIIISCIIIFYFISASIL